MSKYPKSWPVGGHAEAEAKARQLQKLGTKWLRASGPGWVAEKQGRLSNVKHGEEPEYVVVVWSGADNDTVQPGVHPNPRHYWCFIDPRTKRVVGRGDLKTAEWAGGVDGVPRTTRYAHLNNGKLALTKSQGLGLVATDFGYYPVTTSNQGFDFWYDAEQSFDLDGAFLQYKRVEYFQYARLFSDTADVYDRSADLLSIWRHKDDFFVIGDTFLFVETGSSQFYDNRRVGWLGKFSAVEGLEKGVMARTPKALRWGQIQANRYDIFGDTLAAFAKAIAVTGEGVFVLKEPQEVSASSIEYAAPLQIVVLDHALQETGVILQGPANHPYNTWYFNLEVSSRYAVVHEQYFDYEDLPNGRMLIWHKLDGEWVYLKTIDVTEEFLPRPRPTPLTLYSVSPRMVSVFGSALYWLRVVAGENGNNMVEFVWCSIETGECGKKRLDYEEDAEGNVVLDLRRDVVWYEGATLSLRADQVRKRRAPPRKLKREE